MKSLWRACCALMALSSIFGEPLCFAKDLYDVLGVAKDATPSEIKQAHRRLVHELHPDKHPNASAVERKELEARFNEVQRAYDVLSDKEKRARYDRTGSVEEPPAQQEARPPKKGRYDWEPKHEFQARIMQFMQFMGSDFKLIRDSLLKDELLSILKGANGRQLLDVLRELVKPPLKAEGAREFVRFYRFQFFEIVRSPQLIEAVARAHFDSDEVVFRFLFETLAPSYPDTVAVFRKAVSMKVPSGPPRTHDEYMADFEKLVERRLGVINARIEEIMSSCYNNLY